MLHSHGHAFLVSKYVVGKKKNWSVITEIASGSLQQRLLGNWVLVVALLDEQRRVPSFLTTNIQPKSQCYRRTLQTSCIAKPFSSQTIKRLLYIWRQFLKYSKHKLHKRNAVETGTKTEILDFDYTVVHQIICRMFLMQHLIHKHLLKALNDIKEIV